MKILGLDIAGCTGYSVLEDNKLVRKGTISINPKDDHRARFIELSSKIKKLVKTSKPDIVAIEELHSTRNSKVTRLLAMYTAVVILAIPRNIKIITVNANSAKAKVLKLGRKATKEDVFRWAVKRYKLKLLTFEKDNDITDSILVAQYVLDYC